MWLYVLIQSTIIINNNSTCTIVQGKTIFKVSILRLPTSFVFCVCYEVGFIVCCHSRSTADVMIQLSILNVVVLRYDKTSSFFTSFYSVDNTDFRVCQIIVMLTSNSFLHN